MVKKKVNAIPVACSDTSRSRGRHLLPIFGEGAAPSPTAINGDQAAAGAAGHATRRQYVLDVLPHPQNRPAEVASGQQTFGWLPNPRSAYYAEARLWLSGWTLIPRIWTFFFPSLLSVASDGGSAVHVPRQMNLFITACFKFLKFIRKSDCC